MNYCLLLATLSFFGCSATPDSHYYFEKEEKPHARDWGYEGDIGPQYWGELRRKYRLAKTGIRQSPIDIVTTQVRNVDLPPLIFHYETVQQLFVNNGHTIQSDSKGGCDLQVDGTTYRLEQFHLHAPSEHKIDGHQAAMEVHFVHKSRLGKVAVVAVLFEPGDSAKALRLLDGEHLPTRSGLALTAKEDVTPSALLPKGRDYYTYEGSFTTPPCTEGVIWFVLKEPVEAGPNLLEEFRAIHGGNNRPVQPLHGRLVRG